MEVMSYSLPFLLGDQQHFNAGNKNRVSNGSPSLQGSPVESLVSQELSLGSQALPLPSVHDPSVKHLEDAAAQPLNMYPSSQDDTLDVRGPLSKVLDAINESGKRLIYNAGDHQAHYFDTSFSQKDTSCEVQQIPHTSLCGQNIHLNFLQAKEAGLLLNNWQQPNSLSVDTQEQDFTENQCQENRAEKELQKDKLLFACAHCMLRPQASVDSIFGSSQQCNCQSAGQSLSNHDSRTQSSNADESVHQGSFQGGSNQFLNDFAPKQDSSLGRLIQSTEANISSVKSRELDRWYRFVLQKTQSDSAGTSELLCNEKQKSIWDEDSIRVPSLFTGNPYHANQIDASAGIYGYSCSQKGSIISKNQLGSDLQGIQLNNKSKVQSDASCESFHELRLQTREWKDQKSYQVVPQRSSDLRPNADYEGIPHSFWKPISTEQVPLGLRASSDYKNSDRQHNCSLGYEQGDSETDSSQGMLKRKCTEHDYLDKNELQGIQQNHDWLKSNQGFQKHHKEYATCSINEHREHLGKEIYKVDHIRSDHTDNNKLLSLQLQTEREKGCVAIFLQDTDANHLHDVMQGQQKMSEQNHENFSTKLAMLQDNSENNGEMLESNSQVDGNKHYTPDFEAKNEGIEICLTRQQSSSQLWNSLSNKSSDSDQRRNFDLTRAQDGNAVAGVAGNAVDQVDLQEQNAETENNALINNDERLSVLQSIMNVNQEATTQTRWKSIGPVDHFGNEVMQAASASALQFPRRTVYPNDWHPKSAECDSYLEGFSDLESQRQRAVEQIDIKEPNIVGNVFSVGLTHIGMDALNMKLQAELHGSLETRVSLGSASTNLSAQRRSSTSVNLSNVLQVSDCKALNDSVCKEKDGSALQCRSPSDIFPSQLYQNWSSGTLSSQGLSSNPSSLSKLSHLLQCHKPLHLNSFPHATRGLDFIETPIAREPEDLAREASTSHQDSLSEVSYSDKNAHLGQDYPVTSLELSSSSLCVFSGTEDKVVDVKHSTSHITSSDMDLLEAQVCDSDHISTKQQLKSPPSAAKACIQATVMVDDVPGVKLASHIVNQQTHPVVQSTLSASSGSPCQINSSMDWLPNNGSSMNCQEVSGNDNISSDFNRDQPSQVSRASSKLSHLGGPAISDTASFSKLLSNIKALATQQRRSMGAGKTFPCLFESFRSSNFNMGKHFPFLLPNSDDDTCSEKLITTQQLMTSRCTQSYVPCTDNVHPQAPAEELTKQEPIFHPEDFEKVGIRRFPTLPSSSKVFPMRINSYPCNEFRAMPLIGSQGQVQEICLMPTNSSTLLHSVDHHYNRGQTTTILDLHSCTSPNPNCVSTREKNDFINAIQFSSESLFSDIPSQQYPLPNQLMPVMIEKNNEDKNTINSDPGLKVNPKQAVNPLSLPWQAKGVHVGISSRAPWHMCSVDDAKIFPLSSCTQGSMGNGEEDPGQYIVGTLPGPLQKQDYNHNSDESTHSSSAGNDMCQSEPQLQKSVMSQLGSAINDRLFALQGAKMYQGLVVAATSGGIPSHQFIPGKDIQYLSPGTGFVPKSNASITEATYIESEPVVSAKISKVTTFYSKKDDSIQQNSSSLSNIGSPVTFLPKKRKRIVMPLKSSHTEITEAGNGISTISDSELAWTGATNRLPEKNEGDDSYVEETRSISRAKRRLILATQLIQQLVRPLPTAIMCGKASVEYESVIYTSAKSVLEDACKLSSILRISGNPNEFKGLKADSLSREGKCFVERTNGLENEFLRLETSMYMSELRNESRNVERLSIVNRLAKHHHRSCPVASAKSITNGKEFLSDCALSIHKLCTHRYVTALPMPNDIPEGVLCYSL